MSKIKYIEGDVVEAYSQGKGILCHVVNNQNQMGSGVAKAIYERYPEVKRIYHQLAYAKSLKIGTNQWICIEDHMPIINMIAQVLGGSRPLYYNHLSSCLDDISNNINHTVDIIMPLIGAHRAGGEWNIISSIIYDSLVRRGYNVSVYYMKDKLPPNFSFSH